ncbi:MAG: cbb3-type cytochrome c oxidase subunit 3 [Inquilinus sp.]|nr:cbb3-type cytochrome c oxidase subunit 3 [Inquilinus sp.]
MDLQSLIEGARSLWVLWLMLLFLGIVGWVLWPRHTKQIEEHGMIPFKDDDKEH